MTDREKQALLEVAMQRVVTAERELKLAKMALKGALDLACEPEPLAEPAAVPADRG